MKLQSLNGQWQLINNSNGETIAAPVPGDVHAALIKAKKIDDPFYRDNELSIQWIGETDWIYKRTFKATKALLNHTHVLLRCDGLDTLANIRINGMPLANTDNMFRTYEFDVKKLLTEGENIITIQFAAASTYAAKMLKKRYMHGWWGDFKVRGGNYLRKEQCNFGWDWGPMLVTAGIWRNIQLLAFNTARIDDLLITQQHSTEAVTLDIACQLERLTAGQLIADIAIAHDGKEITTKQIPLRGKSCKISINIPNPKLWWPNGMGDQPLYDIIVTLADSEGNQLDQTTRRIGLRTLKLDRHKDQWGESFQFVVNGKSFFAKGANWIPADAILSRLKRDDYQRLLDDTVAANMNMLRVWGGGIYENDCFYDICDELGICVWQDFMFGCATYPAFDKSYLQNVKLEAEDNIKRIRHHPSLALWCGNNELEQGLVDDTWTDRAMSWADYGKIFDKLLPDAVKKLDPQTDYWPSSPHTPQSSGIPRTDFNNPNAGDAHLWNVWHGQQPFEWYRTCTHRFNSEFGFQSFPEPKTIETFTKPDDRNVTSYIMEHHQRSGIGNTTIMRYMLDWFRLPLGFDNTVWLSQIQQGMAMKYACEHWRRSMPRGMGTLYWQINDCWPVASWASIDSLGRWKALHYMARDFFAPLLISGLEDNEKSTVEIHITSDQLKPVKAKVNWILTDTSGKTLAKGDKLLTAKPHKNTLAQTLQLKKYVDKYTKRDLMLWLELKVANKTVSTNFVTFAKPKHLQLQDPKIKASIKKLGEKQFQVAITAKSPALWTWLELTKAEARFSNNFVHLRPGKSAKITVTTTRDLPITAFRKQLSLRSLIDTY